MGETKIEWADYTFNAWVGCTKVSEACHHCYAETWSKRTGGPKWGPLGARRRTTEAYWRQPAKWNREAVATGTRRFVFCCSLADVFDDHESVLPAWRSDLFEVIRQTPHLVWMLLTKRPENIAGMLPADWTDGYPNVWLGTTVENQERAEERIPHLVTVPARLRFLSMEPLQGPVNLSSWSGKIDWIIAGGESGPKARPSHPDWFRGLRDQCLESGTAFHFKQWGEHVSISEGDGVGARFSFPDGATVRRAGKRMAERTLDGRDWDERPQP